VTHSYAAQRIYVYTAVVRFSEEARNLSFLQNDRIGSETRSASVSEGSVGFFAGDNPPGV
jgi:hypothetical protein